MATRNRVLAVNSALMLLRTILRSRQYTSGQAIARSPEAVTQCAFEGKYSDLTNSFVYHVQA